MYTLTICWAWIRDGIVYAGPVGIKNAAPYRPYLWQNYFCFTRLIFFLLRQLAAAESVVQSCNIRVSLTLLFALFFSECSINWRQNQREHSLWSVIVLFVNFIATLSSIFFRLERDRTIDRSLPTPVLRLQFFG